MERGLVWRWLVVTLPWLNAIEAIWVHSKRRVVRANRLLTITELAERASEIYGCPHEPHLVMPTKVA